MALIAHFPSISRFHVVSTPQPRGVTMPKPTTYLDPWKINTITDLTNNFFTLVCVCI